MSDDCPYCSGASMLLTRGGHDPACPAATWFPTVTVKPLHPRHRRDQEVIHASQA